MSGTNEKRAIIVGAGIGGLTAAIALKRAGFEIKIYEQVAEVREVGAGLTLWANAVKALHKLGLGEIITANSLPDIDGTVRSAKGDVLMASSISEFQRRFGAVNVAMHRAELQAALLKVVGEENVCLNARLLKFEQDETGVTAYFSNGETARGAVLIGADGIHSAVRVQLFGESQPRYAGYTAWRAVVPFFHASLIAGETLGHGVRFGVVPLSKGRMYWYATQNAPARTTDQPGGKQQELLKLLRGWHEPIEALIKATPEENILRNDIYDRPPIKQWIKGRVTLLGDAAHPMTPNLGQGACQAIEDAVVLADCLRQEPDVAAALQNYQRRRVERANQIVRRSRLIGQIGQWENGVACWLRDTTFKLLPGNFQVRQFEPIVAYEV